MDIERTDGAPRWHTMTAEQVAAALGTGRDGLCDAERAARLLRHGPNEIQAARRASPWRLLLEQLRNELILILLAATALSAALGHSVEAAAVAVIVALAVALGFTQEYRAERAIEALRELAAPTATVLRGGDEAEVPARDLVPGDVVALRTGDRVPADARVIESVRLKVEESALTGESLPSGKRAEPLDGDDLPLGDRSNMAYAGTAVTYGRGRAVVVATGMDTEFGRITRMLQSVEEPRTPLQESLGALARTLAKGALAVVALVVALGVLRGEPFLEMLLFGVALAVAVVPEALPAVVTISLAVGVQRMARRHALVRRMAAVETLGCTSVICSDKTGTLTRDEMAVREVVCAGARYGVEGAGYAPEGRITHGGAPAELGGPLLELLRAGALCSDARLVLREGRWHVDGDPTEGALVAAAARAGLHRDDLEADSPRVSEVPFTSESKRMTTVHRAPGGMVAYAKGAPEVIVGASERVACAGGDAPLDGGRREAALAEARRMAGSAMRVLAVARREAPPGADVERGLTLLGLVGIVDPPRPEARAAIAACASAGIKTVMITGDHPATARAVAAELGLLAAGRVVTGAELEAMGDDELEREAGGIDVYARVSPAHKLRIVGALQRLGHVVAMTGDGVNDAPALKRADIGVAMGVTGTDVSKEAAAMTLTDDNFASIVAAVEEGRAIYGNIKKYLMYLLSSNIGEIGLMTAAALVGLPLPLTTVQILYVNLATDGLPALALALDPPEDDALRRPPRDPRAGIFTRPVVEVMLAGGLSSTLACTGLFAWALAAGRPRAEATTLVFVALVLIQLLTAYCYRSDRHSALRRPLANRWLNLTVAAEALLLVPIVQLPALQAVFATAALRPGDWLLAVAAAGAVALALELTKLAQRRQGVSP